MNGMIRVRDVMTVGVITAERTTPLRDIVRWFVGERFGSVPVVDDHRVVGIVSRSDVLGADPSQGETTAEHLMTADVVFLSELTSIPEAAKILKRAGVKSAPVVRDGRLVGIVTKTDLLRPYLRTDSEIGAGVETAILTPELEIGAGAVVVKVADGVVTLQGVVARDDQRTLAVKLAYGVPGVVDVHDRLEVARPALH